MKNLKSYLSSSIFKSLCLFALFSTISCKDKTTGTIHDSQSYWENRYSIIKTSDSTNLINNKLLNLDLVMDDPIQASPFIVYYFSAYDCDECILKGFNLIRNFQNNPYPVYSIFYDGASISEIRRKYDFDGNIYLDKYFLLNDQLNLTATPIFIKLDITNKILDIYHIDSNYDGNKKHLKDFLEVPS